jgi:hypothetical protein
MLFDPAAMSWPDAYKLLVGAIVPPARAPADSPPI